MDEYLAEWELADAKLNCMGSPIDERTLITLFLESFGGGQHKDFGAAITALKTQECCNITTNSQFANEQF